MALFEVIKRKSKVGLKTLTTGNTQWADCRLLDFTRIVGTPDTYAFNILGSGNLLLTDLQKEGGGAFADDEDLADFIGCEAAGGGGLVDSVFGRTGIVLAVSGDYDANQVDYDNTASGLTAVDVQAAIDELEDEIDNIVHPPDAVTSVFGRVGVVVSVSGDYDAIQVDYDNTASGLTATDVQAAIDELEDEIDNIVHPPDAVTSVHGRVGVVVSVSGDYDAIQVDYDNTTSGLTATDVQAAIDELEDEIDAIGTAPVDSVFGRTGVVVSVSGDYDSDQIDYDNTTSGLTAVEVQAAIDELDANIDAIAGGIFGTEYNYIEDDTETSTTSTTFVDKVTLVTPSLPSGDYRFTYSWEAKMDQSNTAIESQVLEGATVIGNSMIEPKDGNNYNLLSGLKRFTSISGVKTFKIEFRTTSGSGEAFIRRARLEIFRIV